MNGSNYSGSGGKCLNGENKPDTNLKFYVFLYRSIYNLDEAMMDVGYCGEWRSAKEIGISRLCSNGNDPGFVSAPEKKENVQMISLTIKR